MDYVHFLITRFSVPFIEYESDKNGGKVRNEEWINHRFHLFESYCLPSVMAQSNQSFTWLVFFDIATPSKFKKRIENIKQKYTCFNPMFVISAEEFHDKLKNEIKSQIQDGIKLITSRIDNDDAIHKDYIDIIQQEALQEKKEDLIFNFKWGYQLDLKSGILYQSKDESNPFMSRVSNIIDDKTPTIFDFGHHEAAKFHPIKQLTSPHSWLVIIHDKNMLNTIGGKPLINKYQKLKPFSCLAIGSSPTFFNWSIALVIFFVKGFISKLFK